MTINSIVTMLLSLRARRDAVPLQPRECLFSRHQCLFSCIQSLFPCIQSLLTLAPDSLLVLDCPLVFALDGEQQRRVYFEGIAKLAKHISHHLQSPV